MRNDFEFSLLGLSAIGNDWGMLPAVVIAFLTLGILWYVVKRLSSRQLYSALESMVQSSTRRMKLPTLSSPAEQADTPRAEECEGNGTQVGTPKNSGRIGRAKLSQGSQISTPGSANDAGAMASLARANGDVPTLKQRAARARRG